MPLHTPFGVWKGTILQWSTKEARHHGTKSPHGYLMFSDDSTPENWRGPWSESTYGREWEKYKHDDPRHNNPKVRLPWRSSAINVQSDVKQPEDNRIVYWTGKLENQDIIDSLSSLDKQQFYRISGPLENHVADVPDGFVSVDYHRSNIIKLEDGKLRPVSVNGADNDILDAWDTFFKLAEPYDDSELYIFGTLFEPKLDGIHNVHMNQGNTGPHKAENGIYQDGCIIIKDPNHTWRYFFCGFASQKAETDDVGKATTNETLAEKVEIKG